MARIARANRVDGNQKLIVELLRRLGASVLLLSRVGDGCPDILVGYNGMNALVEIKDGSKSPSGQKLTLRESQFHEMWLGHICVVRHEGEALELFYAMRDSRLGQLLLPK